MTLIGTTPPGQSGTEIYGDEKVLHIPQIPELESHSLIQFHVIPRIPLTGSKIQTDEKERRKKYYLF